jgi:hypothetical protein
MNSTLFCMKLHSNILKKTQIFRKCPIWRNHCCGAVAVIRCGSGSKLYVDFKIVRNWNSRRGATSKFLSEAGAASKWCGSATLEGTSSFAELHLFYLSPVQGKTSYASPIPCLILYSTLHVKNASIKISLNLSAKFYTSAVFEFSVT